MKTIAYFLLAILFVSCGHKVETNSNSKSNCQDKYDTLKFSMYPNYPDTSDFGFIDIRTCRTSIKNDSLVIEINTRDIPDSVTYNNPNINKGFAEYALEVTFRNRKDTCVNNLIFCISYNNFKHPLGAKKESFNSFLKACKSAVLIETNNVLPYKLENNKIVAKFDSSKLKISAKDESIFFKMAKEEVCPYLEDYIGAEFNVMCCYNDSKEKGVNNYITTGVVTDTMIKHRFIYPISRRTN